MTRSQRGDSSVTPDAEGDAVSASASPASVAPAGASVAPLSVADRGGVAMKRAGSAVAEAIRELWLHPDRLVHVIIHGKAETMAAHRAYVKSRGWMPKGLDGGWVAAVGLAHYLVIARPLKASMKAVKFAAEKVDQAADRAVVFYPILIFIVVLFVLLARYL